LPSARGLAAQLGAARGTVEAAYAILAGEGWIIARGAAGTIVTPQLAQAASVTASEGPMPWTALAALVLQVRS
jgi:GntR family transcriptional regulator/MocR family aminotransferase